MLPKISVLWADSWELYKKRFETLILISLLPTVMFFLLAAFIFPTFLSTNQALSAAGVIVSLTAFLVAFFLTLWSQVALVLTLADETLEVKEAFRRSVSKILPYFWVSFLASLSIIGGLILFIIPGIIFAVWLGFATYVVLLEGVGGIGAIKKSKSYVTGRWWPVFGRLVIFMLIAGVVSWAIELDSRMFGPGITKELVSALGNLFLTPFVVTYGFVLYQQVRGSEPA